VPEVQKASAETKRPSRKTTLVLLFNDLDDAACSRFDQNRATVHHGVSILVYTILRRHVVIGNAFFRENRAHSQIFAVLIRRASLFDDIRTKAGTFIDAEHTGYAANDTANHATDNCPDRTSRPFTIPRTPLDAAGDALSLSCNGKKCHDNNSRGSDKTADHENSLGEDLDGSTSSQRRIGSR
jgi:hypothetical protein